MNAGTHMETGKNVKHKTRSIGSPKIIPFIGYANKNETWLSGLVVTDNGIFKPVDHQGKWKNLRSMIKRYSSNELENVKVQIDYLGESQVVTTDRYGIYRCRFSHAQPAEEQIWQKARIRLAEPYMTEDVEGEVMMINHSPEFGVISDVDDTIIVSHATNTLMKLRLMLLNNAHTRMPFEGVGAFYNALQLGTVMNGYNPVFYVSNSEWNLYDLLFEFIQFHRIPKGPIFLRELEIRPFTPWKLRIVNKHHKSETIQKIFSFYPEIKFVLIGDSGQKDPEIYSEVAKQYPGRVLAIYIRDAGIPVKLPAIKIISEHIFEEYKTEMVLVKDTEAAAKHALEKGFISVDHVRPIIEQKEKDREG